MNENKILGIHDISIKDDGTIYKLYAVTEQYYNEIIKDANECSNTYKVGVFKEKYGFSPHSIYIHGKSSVWEVSREERSKLEYYFKEILPKPEFVRDPTDKTIRDSYHCWCVKGLNIPEICNHATPWSSWKCLISSINNPEYCLVIKIKPKTKSDEE